MPLTHFRSHNSIPQCPCITLYGEEIGVRPLGRPRNGTIQVLYWLKGKQYQQAVKVDELLPSSTKCVWIDGSPCKLTKCVYRDDEYAQVSYEWPFGKTTWKQLVHTSFIRSLSAKAPATDVCKCVVCGDVIFGTEEDMICHYDTHTQPKKRSIRWLLGGNDTRPKNI